MSLFPGLLPRGPENADETVSRLFSDENAYKRQLSHPSPGDVAAPGGVVARALDAFPSPSLPDQALRKKKKKQRKKNSEEDSRKEYSSSDLSSLNEEEDMSLRRRKKTNSRVEEEVMTGTTTKTKEKRKAKEKERREQRGKGKHENGDLSGQNTSEEEEVEMEVAEQRQKSKKKKRKEKEGKDSMADASVEDSLNLSLDAGKPAKRPNEQPIERPLATKIQKGSRAATQNPLEPRALKETGKKKNEMKKAPEHDASDSSDSDTSDSSTDEDSSNNDDDFIRKLLEQDQEDKDEEDDDDEDRDTRKQLKGIATEAEKERATRTIFVGNLPPWVRRKNIASLFSVFGNVESIRLRSLPLQSENKLPRRAAIATGAVAEASKGSAHAYVVFEDKGSAAAALAANMRSVRFQRIEKDADGQAKNVMGFLGSEQSEMETRHLIVNPAGRNTFHVKKAQQLSGRVAARAAASLGAKVEYEPSRSIFIGNLHLEAHDEDLIRFFSASLGGVSASRTRSDKDAQGTADIEAVRIVRDAKTAVGKGIAFVLFRTKSARRAALCLDGRKLLGRPLRVMPVRQGASSNGLLRDHFDITGKISNKNNTTDSRERKSSSRKLAPWQGVTATKSGRARGTATPSLHHGAGNMKTMSSTRSRLEVPVLRTRAGKRPAVAARKAKQLSLRKRSSA